MSQLSSKVHYSAPYFLYDLVAIWEWWLLPYAHIPKVLYTTQSASDVIRIPEICNCFLLKSVPFPLPDKGSFITWRDMYSMNQSHCSPILRVS